MNIHTEIQFDFTPMETFVQPYDELLDEFSTPVLH